MSHECHLKDCDEETGPVVDGMAYVYCPAHTEEYAASTKLQLEGWLAGEPEHNHRFDECCPDFSCCRPALLSPLELRKAFHSATGETRESMLWDFLGAMVGDEGIDGVHLAGGP